MTGGTNNKFFSRFVAVAFMALTLAGCALMLSSGQRSLFADVSPTGYTTAAR